MDELHADAQRVPCLFLLADRNRRHLIKCFRLSRRQVEATQPHGPISKVIGERVHVSGAEGVSAAGWSSFINFTILRTTAGRFVQTVADRNRAFRVALAGALCLLWACTWTAAMSHFDLARGEIVETCTRARGNSELL